MLEAIRLDENPKRKLVLFKLLINFSEKKRSIHFFENNLDYSYSRVVYLLDLTQQDLTNLTGKSMQLIQTSSSYSAHKQLALILDIVYLRIRSGYTLHEKTEIMP